MGDRAAKSAAEKPHGDADHDNGGERGGPIDEEVHPAPSGRGAIREDHGAGHAGDESVVNAAVVIKHTARIVPQGDPGGKA